MVYYAGRFLKYYLYIPLGGNQTNSLIIARNLIIVFLIGGLWHGASFGFLLWGGLNGAAMIIYHFWKKYSALSLYAPMAWLLTFNFIHLSRIPFRARNMDITQRFYETLLGFYDIGNLASLRYFTLDLVDLYSALLIIGISPIILYAKNSNDMFIQYRPNIKNIFFTGLLFSVALTTIFRPTYFIYFNF